MPPAGDVSFAADAGGPTRSRRAATRAPRQGRTSAGARILFGACTPNPFPRCGNRAGVLRPLLAFATLSVAAFLLAPTVSSVGRGVEDLHIVREMPWSIWKWYEIPPPESILPPDCDYARHDMVSEVTKWPQRITKNESFTIGGYVVRADNKQGVASIKVDLFLNATKEAPGEFLGSASTDGAGRFAVETKVPHDLDATKYHLVAHSLQKQVDCKIWRESWSDPEMEVTAKTRIVWDLPARVVLGRNMTVAGRVLDEVGGPVRNGNVTLVVEGQTLRLTTDGIGAFSHVMRVNDTGDVDVTATFDSTKYYGASSSTASVPVVPEDVQVDGADAPLGVLLTRSRETVVTGTVLVGGAARPGEVQLAFEGLKVSSCADCPAASAVKVTPDENGTFSVPVWVASDQAPGAHRLTVTGGGLKQTHAFNSTLAVPVTLVIDAKGAGLFTKDYEGTVTAVDDAGDPAPGPVQFHGPDQPFIGTADAAGVFAFQGRATCGFHDVSAQYAGDDTHLGTSATSRMGVCGPLAYLPAWLLDTPGWVWAIAVVLAAGALLAARQLRNRYAPTIRRGPPLDLRIVEPEDLSPDVVAVGETVRLTAFLDDPLPKGHVLRMGSYGHMEPREVADDLRASYDFVPERLGDYPLRAEVLDERGRIVTRRTVHVRAVQYAAEVERRYRALKVGTAGDEADVVTPREFESWLRQRSPDLDPALSRRLVGIFEEADYGPRDTSRDAYLAYLEAERGLPEVARHA